MTGNPDEDHMPSSDAALHYVRAGYSGEKEAKLITSHTWHKFIGSWRKVAWHVREVSWYQRCEVFTI
jgi:hypothetical protein